MMVSSSQFKFVVDGLDQFLGRWRYREAQDRVSLRFNDARRLMNELKPDGLQALQQVTVGPFAGSRLLRRRCLELKASEQVVSQDGDLLPGRVGIVMIGGHRSQ